MRRRAAEHLALLLAAAIVVGAADERKPDLQILHCNDIHAVLDPADASFGTNCGNVARGAPACFGGAARLATALNEARAEGAAVGMDSLVLHAGDQFTGTLWDVVYTSNGVLIDAPILAELGIQAFTLGNHEFDHGPELAAQFVANLTELGIPVVGCNVDVSKEPAFDGVELKKFTIIELPKSGTKVGIVGLTTTSTSYNSSPGPNIAFLNYTDVLPACVAAAKAAGAQRIIALTHIGYQDDQALAADPAAAGVDLIVGGHSHTLLYGEPAPAGQPQVASTPPPILVSPPTNESNTPGGPYPTLIKAADGRALPIVQALWGSRYMGKLATTWAPEGGLLAANGSVVLLGGANSTNEVLENVEMALELDDLRGAINALNDEIIGSSLVNLDGSRVDVRNNETNLGDLLCESWMWFVNSTTQLQQAYGGAPLVCLYSGGTIHESIAAGAVSYGEVLDAVPYSNFINVINVNSSVLIDALQNGVSGWTGNSSAQGRFPQVGGLRYSFNPTLPPFSQLVAAELVLPSGAVPLADYEGPILLVTPDYDAQGGDNYTMFATAPLVLDTSTLLTTAISNYIQAFSPINITTDGRIINCAQNGTNPLCTGAPAAVPAPPSAAVASGWGSWAWLVAASVVAALLL